MIRYIKPLLKRKKYKQTEKLEFIVGRSFVFFSTTKLRPLIIHNGLHFKHSTRFNGTRSGLTSGHGVSNCLVKKKKYTYIIECILLCSMKMVTTWI